MAKNKAPGSTPKCPISGTVCTNCPLYRGRHFNIYFQNHYGDDDRKGTGPLKSMGYPAAAIVVKITCSGTEK